MTPYTGLARALASTTMEGHPSRYHLWGDPSWRVDFDLCDCWTGWYLAGIRVGGRLFCIDSRRDLCWKMQFHFYTVERQHLRPYGDPPNYLTPTACMLSWSKPAQSLKPAPSPKLSAPELGQSTRVQFRHILTRMVLWVRIDGRSNLSRAEESSRFKAHSALQKQWYVSFDTKGSRQRTERRSLKYDRHNTTVQSNTTDPNGVPKHGQLFREYTWHVNTVGWNITG